MPANRKANWLQHRAPSTIGVCPDEKPNWARECKNGGGIHGANPRGQNTVLSWNFTKLMVLVCRTEMLVMLCLAYTDTTLPVLRFRKEDAHRGFPITKPKLSANCSDPLNFSRVN